MDLECDARSAPFPTCDILEVDCDRRSAPFPATPRRDPRCEQLLSLVQPVCVVCEICGMLLLFTSATQPYERVPENVVQSANCRNVDPLRGTPVVNRAERRHSQARIAPAPFHLTPHKL